MSTSLEERWMQSSRRKGFAQPTLSVAPIEGLLHREPAGLLNISLWALIQRSTRH
jgi:hypothetical protein